MLKAHYTIDSNIIIYEDFAPLIGRTNSTDLRHLDIRDVFPARVDFSKQKARRFTAADFLGIAVSFPL